MASPPDQPAQILLFSLPRTGCHLLEKMIISKQENLKQCWHPHSAGPAIASFAMSDWLQKDDFDTTNLDLTTNLRAQVQLGIEKWEKDLAEAQQQGQTLYMHDHIYFLSPPSTILSLLSAFKNNHPPIPPPNPTTLPPSLLLQPNTTPILTIRHPTLTIPSNYRAMNLLVPNPSANNTISSGDYHCLRDIHNFYLAHNITPIVLDADDYMTSEEFVLHICNTIPGLEAEKAVLSWSKTPEKEQEEMNPHLVKIQNTLMSSQGLVPGRAARNLDLEGVQSKWAEEFGEEKAELFRKLVRFNLPAYEYLHERRLRL